MDLFMIKFANGEKRIFNSSKKMRIYIREHVDYDSYYNTAYEKDGKLVCTAGVVRFVSKITRNNGAVVNHIDDIATICES